MKIKINKSILKQAVESVMKQNIGNPKQQLIIRILGLTPRNGQGIDEKRFVDLLNMVMKLNGGYNVLMKFLQLHQGVQPINQVTPPGKEKMVRALKKNPDIDNPWAVRWRAYNKQHGKK